MRLLGLLSSPRVGMGSSGGCGGDGGGNHHLPP